MSTQRPVIGTILDGDLQNLVVPGPRGRLGRRQLLAPTWDDLTRHVILIGGTGTGKTVTLLRLAQATFATGPAEVGGPPPAVIYLDAKGLPDANRDSFLAMAEGAGARNIIDWPNTPIDGFTGNTDDLRERLSGLWDAEESPFHHAEAVVLLRLILQSSPTPRTLSDLVARSRPGATAAAFEAEGTPEALIRKYDAEQMSKAQWNGLHLRLAALEATAGNRLDRTPVAHQLHEADAAWISIPGTRAPQSAADITAWLLHIVADLATRPGRKRRTLVILDEFSAIGADKRSSSAAAGLVERTRSSGIALVVSTQTIEALGVNGPRLLRTAGTVVTHRTPQPDQLIALAGTEARWEDSHTLDNLGRRRGVIGKSRQENRIPANLIRELPVGEAVVIHQGRWGHVAVAHVDGAAAPA